MKKSYFPKEENEPHYAELFISWLNIGHNFDYIISLNSTQDDPVDAYALSPTQKPKLNFQITIADGGFLAAAGFQHTHRKFKPAIVVDSEVSIPWIKDAIKRKAEKLYPNPQDLILLVGGYAPVASPALIENQLCGKYDDLRFRGIYYVVTPQSEYPSGFVVAIKDAFTDSKFDSKLRAVQTA